MHFLKYYSYLENTTQKRMKNVSACFWRFDPLIMRFWKFKTTRFSVLVFANLFCWLDTCESPCSVRRHSSLNSKSTNIMGCTSSGIEVIRWGGDIIKRYKGLSLNTVHPLEESSSTRKKRKQRSANCSQAKQLTLVNWKILKWRKHLCFER